MLFIITKKGYDSNVTTPQENYPELAKAIGLAGIYFKREDMHALGSHKGRSIPVMIDNYLKNGDLHFAISSSGNAALAAALYVREVNSSPISLDIFVGNNIKPDKLNKLRDLSDDNIRVLIKERPLQALTQAASEGARSLRQSTDDVALIGYESLAKELVKIKDIGAVFIGTSSGTTAQALAQYFIAKKLPIQVHIVQTSSCHHMADAFETFDIPDEKSTADAIVDQTAHRKSDLIPLIKETGGRGWLATNENIIAAQEMTRKYAGLDISTNSALSVVGAIQAAEAGYDMRGVAVCLICGE